MNARAVDTVVCIPIVVGSVAYYLGKKTDEATHRWTLYIRGPNDEDLSCFVTKVEFILHPSFKNQVREVLKSPFEVTEVGWGEFEATIRLHFKDPHEFAIDLYHQVKLYPPGPSQPLSTKKPVVSETYDEILFTDPKEYFLRCLMNYTPSGTSANRPSTLPAEACTVFDDERDVNTLTCIHDHLLRETEIARQRLIQIESEIAHLIDLNLVSKALPMSSQAIHLTHHQTISTNLTKLVNNSKKEYQQQTQLKLQELQREAFQQHQLERQRLGLPPLPLSYLENVNGNNSSTSNNASNSSSSGEDASASGSNNEMQQDSLDSQSDQTHSLPAESSQFEQSAQGAVFNTNFENSSTDNVMSV